MDNQLEETPAEGRGEPAAAGADFIIPGLAVAFTSYYIVSTAHLTWEARSTGWLVGFSLLALCLIQIIALGRGLMSRTLSPGFGDLLANTQNNRRRLGLLVAMLAFTSLLPITGTTLGLLLVLVAGMLIMGVRNPRHLAGVSLITAALVFTLFIWLTRSRMPQGALDHALLALIAAAGG